MREEWVNFLICILKRLVWWLGCGELSMEVMFQAEMKVVALRGELLQDWDLRWRKSQQDLLVDWVLGGEGEERAEVTFRLGNGEFWWMETPVLRGKEEAEEWGWEWESSFGCGPGTYQPYCKTWLQISDSLRGRAVHFLTSVSPTLLSTGPHKLNPLLMNALIATMYLFLKKLQMEPKYHCFH